MTTAIVIGANRGIGWEISRQLCARGDTVFAVCRRASAALQRSDCHVIEGVDVCDDDLGGLPERLQGVQIDLLVHNAGVLEPMGLQGLDLASIRRQFEVNAVGPLKTVAALRHLLAAGARAPRPMSPSAVVWSTSPVRVGPLPGSRRAMPRV